MIVSINESFNQVFDRELFHWQHQFNGIIYTVGQMYVEVIRLKSRSK